MNVRPFLTSCGAPLMVSLAAAGLWGSSVLPAFASAFEQTNLVSDGSLPAMVVDPNLVNAWGISESSSSPFWISDNGSGLSTLYSVPASGPPSKLGLVVTIPPTAGGTTSSPTGQVFNGGPAFGGANFLFASEDGVISGWKSGTTAVTDIDKGSAAVYKGLAISNPGASGAILYATNFRAGTIEAYDGGFGKPASVTGDFADPSLPAGYAPFNDRVFGSELYVTYALQDSTKHDDQAGASNGFVDVFNLDGTLNRRLVSRGNLDSPWGLAMAPDGFGSFGGDLLVGNFGEGMINAYNATTGAFMGTLDGTNGNPLMIDGLWGLTFGNGAAGGSLSTLYFTAGPDGEQHGLFGSLTAVPEPSTWAMMLAGFAGLAIAGCRSAHKRAAAIS